jgi:hypothetical protein
LIVAREQRCPLARAQLEHRSSLDVPTLWDLELALLSILCACGGALSATVFCFGFASGLPFILLLVLFDHHVLIRNCLDISKECQRQLDEYLGQLEEVQERFDDRLKGALDRRPSRIATRSKSRRNLATVIRRQEAWRRKEQDRPSEPGLSWNVVGIALLALEWETSEADSYRELLAIYQSMIALVALFESEDEALCKARSATLLAIVAALEALRRKLAAGVAAAVSTPCDLIADLLSPHVLAAGGGPGLFVARC